MRCFRAPDGCTILVGRDAADNEALTFRVARPNDRWLHVAAGAGAHVVVQAGEGAREPSRVAVQLAADLAAYYSDLRGGGRVAVHVSRCADVYKPRGATKGQVGLRRYRTIQARPERARQWLERGGDA